MTISRSSNTRPAKRTGVSPGTNSPGAKAAVVVLADEVEDLAAELVGALGIRAHREPETLARPTAPTAARALARSPPGDHPDVGVDQFGGAVDRLPRPRRVQHLADDVGGPALISSYMWAR